MRSIQLQVSDAFVLLLLEFPQTDNMDVPPFAMYFPSVEFMSAPQRAFYDHLEQRLNRGKTVDVQGQISYLFTYIYKLIDRWNVHNFPNLSQTLIHLAEEYHREEKIKQYCLHWAYDCLLGQMRYDEFLEKTEPKHAYGTDVHRSNLRLNIQKHIGVEANPLDVLLMFGGRRTQFIIKNEAHYKQKVIEAIQAYADALRGWFSIFKALGSGVQPQYQHSLFSGVPISPKPQLDFRTYCFYATHVHGFGLTDTLKALSKEAENVARAEAGIPKVGEGWVSETSLFRKLESEFHTTTVIQHGQPQWLGRQHFDIWFPHWRIAVEFHGRQHFEPVEFFGGAESFAQTRHRDDKKRDMAQRHGVRLFVVTDDDDPALLIASIREVVQSREVEFEAWTEETSPQ